MLEGKLSDNLVYSKVTLQPSICVTRQWTLLSLESTPKTQISCDGGVQFGRLRMEDLRFQARLGSEFCRETFLFSFYLLVFQDRVLCVTLAVLELVL